MARKTAAQAVEEQIKDQAFSELQALIEHCCATPAGQGRRLWRPALEVPASSP